MADFKDLHVFVKKIYKGNKNKPQQRDCPHSPFKNTFGFVHLRNIFHIGQGHALHIVITQTAQHV